LTNGPESGVPGAPPLELIPLGGLGEFGMNMMLIACGDTAILVDAGVMFPEPDLLGVDLIIPDVRQLRQYKIRALVLTHGHEDHIGAVPHVVPHFDGPIYGTKLTIALVEPKLVEHGADVRARLTEVAAGDRVTIGSFTIEFLRVTHSMPDCVAAAIRTPAGLVLHTGDFKIDQTPLDGQPVDLQRFAQLGAEGVLLLLADSTNVDRKGVSGSERDVIDGFEEIYTSARGRIVVAMFSSSLFRMQVLVDLADQFDRKVAFIGRGVIENSQIAMRLGYLRVPPGVQIRDSDIRNYPSQDVVIICTGSQGEPQAALPRIAIDDHRLAKLDHDDTVVFSAREIPGNEKAIGRVMNHIAKRTSSTRGSSTCTCRGTAARRSSSSCFRSSGHATSCRYTGSTASSHGTPGWRSRCRPGPGRCWRRTATSSVSTRRARESPGRCPPAGS
jgi:ribonuclease J